MPQNQKEKILVAISGGVDSAVSAMLLKQDGHPVEAVYVRTWEHEEDPAWRLPWSQRFKRCRGCMQSAEDSISSRQLLQFLQVRGCSTDGGRICRRNHSQPGYFV